MIKSKQNEFVFQTGLFEQVTEIYTLRNAFSQVRSNKGAPGIDGVTVEMFESQLEENLRGISKELTEWRYQPKPVKRVEIPKPSGGVRMLGIPCVRDRIVQASIKMVIEPKLEPVFSESSFGFRPNRNQRQAVEKAREHTSKGKEYVVDIDLSKFFDRINHDRLIYRLGLFIEDKRILKVIGLTLRSGIMTEGLYSSTLEGAVQGSPLSPLLSNVVLDELDKEIEQRGLSFCRFADDCNIFVRTEKAAQRVMASISKFIEHKLKLKVNQEKSKIGMSKQIKFLGMTIIATTIAISQISMERAKTKVKELSGRTTGKSIETIIQNFNKWYVGWSNYHKMTEYPNQLLTIESHFRRRVRTIFIVQQKKKRNLYKKLAKLGVSKRASFRTVYSNRGTWALSHSKAVERALSNSWFARKGMKVVSQDTLSHWKSLTERPKFNS